MYDLNTIEGLTDAHLYGGLSAAELAEGSEWSEEELTQIFEKTTIAEKAKDLVREAEVLNLLSSFGFPVAA